MVFVHNYHTEATQHKHFNNMVIQENPHSSDQSIHYSFVYCWVLCSWQTGEILGTLVTKKSNTITIHTKLFLSHTRSCVFSTGMQIHYQKVPWEFSYNGIITHSTVEQRTHYKYINIILSNFFPFHLNPCCVMLYA